MPVDRKLLPMSRFRDVVISETNHSAGAAYKTCWKVQLAHHGHILFAAVTEVGGAHQVQEAAIRGNKTGHRLWELR